MATILDGKFFAAKIREEVTASVGEFYRRTGISPGLTVVIVGEDPASKVYVNRKHKACQECEIRSEIIRLQEEATEKQLLDVIDRLNGEDSVHGILVQLPLPRRFNTENVLNRIRPDKDVDGFHPINVGNLSVGRDALIPCTPNGVVRMLEIAGIPIEGKKATIIGRSNIVGKPMLQLLLARNATVTVCHSKTVNLAEITRQADILVAAIGKPNFVTENMVGDGAVVIDVGINRVGEKLVGDVDFETVKEKASAITPVPGGVGPLTIAMLLHNTIKAANIQFAAKKRGGVIMKSDVEIAQEAKMQPIKQVAAELGLSEDDLELYGKYKAKVSLDVWEQIKDRPSGKIVLVTAINPTPAGEGKTTNTVGIGDALRRLGKKVIIALREPSLGPCFGVKGGAAGGGYAQVVPMEDINLHFTGDIHAVSTANNLLAAIIDNHIHHGNELNIDPRRITWRRVMDLNERALRSIVLGLGGKANGIPREGGFDIAVASEMMAILCLASDLEDMKERINKIIVAYTYDNKPITVADLKVAGALTLLFKDAIKPNLVQTLENTPAFIHGGPFANIAHGCNSVMASKFALKMADILVTEAGFGADLGAEKFCDIKCRFAGFQPDAVVIVTTVRALKSHGGVPKADLGKENMAALEKGLENLTKHIENIGKFGLPAVVAINAFPTDAKAELVFVEEKCQALGAEVALSEVWAKGGAGGEAVAGKVLAAIDKPKQFRYLYDEKLPIKEKIETIASEIYGAEGVDYTASAAKTIAELTALGFDKTPICMAKTQYSLTDDATKLGRPSGFKITVREVRVSAGAGFLIAICGEIMTMPGLPKRPAAEVMDIDNKGKIVGLF